MYEPYPGPELNRAMTLLLRVVIHRNRVFVIISTRQKSIESDCWTLWASCPRVNRKLVATVLAGQLACAGRGRPTAFADFPDRDERSPSGCARPGSVSRRMVRVTAVVYGRHALSARSAPRVSRVSNWCSNPSRGATAMTALCVANRIGWRNWPFQSRKFPRTPL